MKDRTKGFIAGFLLCALLIGLGIPVGAATYKKAVEVYYRNIKVTVDSQEVTPKDAQGNKVEPFIMNGTTYLPVRGIAYALGMDVRWDNATSTVSLYTSGNGAVDEDSMVDKIDTGKVWRYEGDDGIIVFRFNPASLEFEGYTCPNDSDNMAPFRGTYTEIDGSLNLWYQWIFDDTGSTFHDVYGISFPAGRFSLTPVEGRSAISGEFGSDLIPFNVDKQTTASYLHELIDDLIAGERYW